MGSLLGITVNSEEYSFPVGKVNILKMYQLDFGEYLTAINEIDKIEIIKEHYKNNEPIIEMMHKQLIDLYKKYLFLGGMPEVIKTYVETNDLQMARIKQNEIVDTYRDNETFKFYMNDVGLLGAKAKILYEEIISEEEFFLILTKK